MPKIRPLLQGGLYRLLGLEGALRLQFFHITFHGR